MNQYTLDTPVGEIAARTPSSVHLFEQLGIDFCCGGRLTLGAACAEKGLDPALVIDRLAGTVQPVTVPEVDWQSAPLEELIDHILTAHHAYLKAQLPRIEVMLEKVLSAHGHNHGAVLYPLAETFRALKEELDSHLMKEEMILFPLIRGLDAGAGAEETRFHCGSVGNPIRVMVAEHDAAGGALEHLLQLTGGYVAPSDACTTFRALYADLEAVERDLHRHIHLENNILFPRALEMEAATAAV